MRVLPRGVQGAGGPRADDGWVRGAVAISPLLVGIVPFGIVAGVTGVENGASPAEAIAFSLLAFAIASQIAAFELLGSGAPLAVVIGTGVMINLRFVMYSASLAPYLVGEPTRRRLLGAYLLTDHAYAVALGRYAERPPPRSRAAYYLGAAIAFWLACQVATVAGALLGTRVPEQVPLEVVAPLTFLALLVPTMVDRPGVTAAVVGAAVATAAYDAPGGLGMLTGALIGAVAGAAVSRRNSARAGRR
ncbi:MAG TPA: AzlC family ABC transporter permease [Egibacteraceae bacterium]|nr:AzlC family ABC transporter permease [Egibacteraceae bacterium]